MEPHVSAHRFETAPTDKLLDDGTVATGNRTYDQLPRSIKDQHTFEEWMWLGDTDKANLIQNETEPDY